jgi:predicted dinucleotide-binding enzyme
VRCWRRASSNSSHEASNGRIRVLGRGPLAEPLARLAERAGHTVPLAGDDSEANSLVAQFMREIGVEPFDLGALGSADVLEPGGALWRKALSQVEMLEAVGWLSGDG